MQSVDSTERYEYRTKNDLVIEIKWINITI